MLNEALKNLFTLHGVITTLLQIMIVIGIFTAYPVIDYYIFGTQISSKK